MALYLNILSRELFPLSMRSVSISSLSPQPTLVNNTIDFFKNYFNTQQISPSSNFLQSKQLQPIPFITQFLKPGEQLKNCQLTKDFLNIVFKILITTDVLSDEEISNRETRIDILSDEEINNKKKLKENEQISRALKFFNRMSRVSKEFYLLARSTQKNIIELHPPIFFSTFIPNFNARLYFVESYKINCLYIDKNIDTEFFSNQSSGLEHLTHLIIKNSTIDNPSFEKILKKLTKLVSLNLDWCINIEKQTIQSFGENLTSLNLKECNYIDNTALETIAQQCTRLVHLDLSWCEDINKIGIQNITTKLTILKNLNLIGCGIDSQDILTLSRPGLQIQLE